jgi:hypothetical protein
MMTTGDDNDPDPPEWKSWWSWILVGISVILLWVVITIVVKALR